jgi:hypothetical protein
MAGELFKCSNLIGNRIADTGAQTVSYLYILIAGLVSQRELRRDRRSINGAQAGYERKLPEPLGIEGSRGRERAAPGARLGPPD